MTFRALTASVLFAALFLAILGCSGGKQEQVAEAPLVTVAAATEQTVPADDELFTGRTVAPESIEIRSRVTGYLAKVLFKDGDEVTAGTPLFEIDQRPAKANLARAEGHVTQAEARLARLENDLRRAEKLVTTGGVAREDYEKVLGDRNEAEAALKSAVANVEGNKLDLEFCTIKAPIAGRIGQSEVDPGNLIKADSTLLTTIVTVDPMYATFDIDEGTMLRIQRLIREGKVGSGDQNKVPVFLGTDDEKDDEDPYPHEGTLNFIDNQVDPNTGKLRARATFPNPRVNAQGKEDPKGNRVLSPGLFARFRVPIGQPYKAILVSERALMSDQGQKFVYVVKDTQPSRRLVEVGPMKGGLRVILPAVKKEDGTIARGLEPGELVVVNGVQRVRVGKPIRHDKPVEMSSIAGSARTN